MDATWTSALTVRADHPAFDGHFPGRPILPGVALLAEVLEAALAEPTLARSLGAAPRLLAAKFFVPVAPGASLAIVWRATTKSLDWNVSDGMQDVARGQFTRSDAAPATTP